MIEIKKKKCKKGTGKFLGFEGCGQMIPAVMHKKSNFKYGLGISCGCYLKALNSHPDKDDIIAKATLTARNKIKKEKIEDNKNKKLFGKFNFYQSTAWRWCKKYVLLYYANEDLMVNCSTSPHLVYYVTDRNLHVGHFIKYKDGNSSNNSTALLFENLAPQSYVDNVRYGGKPEVMRSWLIEVHGEDKINELNIIKRQPLKLDRTTLKEYSDKYRKLFYDLLKERGIENPWA